MIDGGTVGRRIFMEGIQSTELGEVFTLFGRWGKIGKGGMVVSEAGTTKRRTTLRAVDGIGKESVTVIDWDAIPYISGDHRGGCKIGDLDTKGRSQAKHSGWGILVVLVLVAGKQSADVLGTNQSRIRYLCAVDIIQLLHTGAWAIQSDIGVGRHDTGSLGGGESRVGAAGIDMVGSLTVGRLSCFGVDAIRPTDYGIGIEVAETGASRPTTVVFGIVGDKDAFWRGVAVAAYFRA